MKLQLHDNFQPLSQDETLDVWPPIQWNEFRPNSRAEILDHYYAYSTGCKSPTVWGIAAMSAGAVAAAAFGPALLAGAKSALSAIKLKGVFAGVNKSVAKLGTSTKLLLSNEAVQTMSKQVEGQAKKDAKKAANTAKQKARRQLDSGAERDRIVETYQRQYNKMQQGGFQSNIGSMSLDQLKQQLAAAKNSVKVSADKCKKTPCDTAGCRNMGVLTARVQYIEALIKAYTSTNTATPQGFDQKFSKQAVDGKTSMGSIISGFGLPLLIIGGLLLSQRKK